MTQTPYQKFNLVDADGNLVSIGSGGGGGGGDASAANQQSQITLETAILDRLMPPGTIVSYLGTSAGANLKTSAGSVYAITCSNNNSLVRYFQLFNKATTPVADDVPTRSFPVMPNDGLLVIGQDVVGGSGIPLSTGIGWGFSSTRLTYSPATATDCIATVRWA